MKRHVQFEGVRKWAGDHLLELQREPLKVLDEFFGSYGSFVLKGCEITASGGVYNVTPGLVVLAGRDRSGVDTTMVVPFAGVSGVSLPVYLTLDSEVRNFEYADGGVKPIAYNYYAKASTVEPAEGISFLLLDNETPRFSDVIQDAEHRFITDIERESWNTIRPELKKFPTYRGAFKGVDANDIREYGTYLVNAPAGALNYPIAGFAGMFVVDVSGYNNESVIVQTAMMDSLNTTWRRAIFTGGGVWTAWVQVVTMDDLPPAPKLRLKNVSGWTGTLSTQYGSVVIPLTEPMDQDSVYFFSFCRQNDYHSLDIIPLILKEGAEHIINSPSVKILVSGGTLTGNISSTRPLLSIEKLIV